MDFHNKSCTKNSTAVHNHVKNDKRDMNGGKIELTHITRTTEFSLSCTQVTHPAANMLHNRRHQAKHFLIK